MRPIADVADDQNSSPLAGLDVEKRRLSLMPGVSTFWSMV